MFKATISDKGLLVDSISTIAELIDEGLFKISKDGLSLVAADRAMVAVVDFKLNSNAFDSFETDKDQTIGVNVSTLLSVLKRVGGEDKITLTLHDSSKLEILMQNSMKRKFIVPLINLTQEEVPPIDQLEFTADVELNPDILHSGIEDAEVVADSVLFEITPSRFSMRGEGDISRAELELEKGDKSLINLKVEGSAKARYPLDYLKKMIKAAKIADSVKIHFGQDYPMKLEFNCGDKCHMNFVIAPRVSEE